MFSFKVSEALKREFYKAMGEAQARSGSRVEIKDVAARGLAYAIAELRGRMPRQCKEAADEVLSLLEAEARG